MNKAIVNILQPRGLLLKSIDGLSVEQLNRVGLHAGVIGVIRRLVS
jgi:hypothetical protein